MVGGLVVVVACGVVWEMLDYGRTFNLNRRGFLRSLGAVAALCGGMSRAAGRASKPNIVVILVDDLGWTDLGCFGSGYYETPNIDRLCRAGMKFTNGYAACSVCSPTRAALLTGRYPARTGITDWIHFADDDAAVAAGENPTAYVGSKDQAVLCPPNPFWMDLEERTLAEVLKEAGYTSCHVGKWHLGDAPWYPEEQGFDYNFGGCDYGQPPSYFDPYARNAQRPNIPTLPPRKKGEYLTTRESDEATGFIRKHADGPFFLHMAHYCVHMPLQGRPDLVEKYEGRPTTNHSNPKYAAMVESVDEAVGNIMRTLDELGLAENTITLFTSDNGGHIRATDNAPLRSGKGYAFEGGIRVPVIFHWPGKIPGGTVRDEPVISVDYFPTFLKVAGVPVPGDRVIDGMDLSPMLLGGEETLGRDALYWHFPHYRAKDVPPYSIIRAGDWKLIRQYDGKRHQLFNLKDDLSEAEDLAARMPEKVGALDARLSKHLAECGAKIPRANPDYEGEA